MVHFDVHTNADNISNSCLQNLLIGALPRPCVMFLASWKEKRLGRKLSIAQESDFLGNIRYSGE